MSRLTHSTAAALVLLLLGVSTVSGLRLGGIERASVSDDRVQQVASYAVQQLNERGEASNGGLELSKILSVRKQLVAGTLYFLNIEATDGNSDEARNFEVAVYEPFGEHTHTLKLTHYREAGKPTNAELVEPADTLTTALTAAQPVEVTDELAEGAAYAVMQLTQQSNSLIPWTLKEVVDAHRIADGVYQVSLRVVRGQEEKVFKVNLRQASEDWLVMGSFVPVSA